MDRHSRFCSYLSVATHAVANGLLEAVHKILPIMEKSGPPISLLMRAVLRAIASRQDTLVAAAIRVRHPNRMIFTC